ncbi:MFS transporter [Streptomyces spiralis]
MTTPGRRRGTVAPGRRGTLRTHRDVIGLTGPWLPVLSFLGRLPTATVQFGSVLLVARTSGSLAAAGLTGGAHALGQVACGPLVGRLADRHGRRTVVLVLSLADAAEIAALVAGALAGAGGPLLAALGAGAGATVPLVGPLVRARLVALARRSGAPDAIVGTGLSFESTLDEISFVLGPALVGLASVLAHPAYALGAAALLVGVCGTGFALHPTAAATRRAAGPRPGPGGDRPAPGRRPPARAHRPRMPRCVHALRAASALQGAMFGACQAGITAFTRRLGEEDQAGLVYAAMGVMGAVAGLSTAALPARFGLRARRRRPPRRPSYCPCRCCGRTP